MFDDVIGYDGDEVVNQEVVEVKSGGATSFGLSRLGFVKVPIAGISKPDVGSFLKMIQS